MTRTLSLVALLVAGCGSTAPAPNTISGAVTYAGARDGSLILGAYPSIPPMGAPIAFQVIDQPRFPQSYQIVNVPDGSFYVIAVLDVGRDSPTNPGPEDVMAPSSSKATVSAASGGTVDIALADR